MKAKFIMPGLMDYKPFAAALSQAGRGINTPTTLASDWRVWAQQLIMMNPTPDIPQPSGHADFKQWAAAFIGNMA